ncbi:MAG: hypothetical protein IK083_07690, partial [Abditibacteriota bacterium]|nr:hypothetical protein [Abditibacteriota bacterium]
RDVIRQTELMDPLVHLLGKKRYFTPRPATHVRIVSGTADEHASFTLGLNLFTAANMRAADSAEYALVWNMVHGDREGTSRGTFLEWVKTITAEDAGAVLYHGERFRRVTGR